MFYGMVLVFHVGCISLYARRLDFLCLLLSLLSLFVKGDKQGPVHTAQACTCLDTPPLYLLYAGFGTNMARAFF